MRCATKFLGRGRWLVPLALVGCVAGTAESALLERAGNERACPPDKLRVTSLGASATVCAAGRADGRAVSSRRAYDEQQAWTRQQSILQQTVQPAIETPPALPAPPNL